MKAALMRVLTPAVITDVRNRGKSLGLGPIVTLVTTVRVSGDTIVSRFNLLTGDPITGIMIPQSTVTHPVDLPIVLTLFDGNPEHQPYSGMVNEKDKPMWTGT